MSAALDDELIDRVVTRHPSPIADAIMALAAAESVHERRDRVVEAFRVILRYLAAVSLAARLVKRPPEGDGEQVVKLVETLRARSLTDGQWWNLVRELVKPWAKRAAEHPIPALVEVLANPKINKEIDALLGMRKSETVAHGTTGSKEGVVAILAEREPVLARLLAAIEPIHAQARLVVGEQTGEHAKSLVGATPARALYRKLALAPTGNPLEPGRCYLVDPHNALLVDLDPLIRFGPPAVAALPEVFFLDGRTPRGGGRYLSLPAASERSEPQVWERLDAAFAPPPPAAAGSAATARPYRGLARFEKSDAAMFFGRDAEIQELANRIRAHPMLTLTGPSGSGKSSLLAAGVTAALAVPDADTGRRGAIAVTVRPGRDLVRELAAALELEDVPAAELAATARSRVGDRLLVIIVDQAEELLTLATSPEQAAAAAALLVELGAGEAQTSPTRVVLSVREDFFAQLSRIAPLRSVYDRQVMVLGPLDRAAMLRAVVEPAAAFGVRYEEGVAEAMVDEILDRPGALPLLQFAADRLWDVRTLDGDGSTISRDEYDSIGGVAGALAAHAEALYAQLLPNQQEAARAVMLRLVTREGTRAIVPREELVVLPDAAPVIARLEDARLVSTRQDAAGTGVCELVHEALIAHWPRLGEWRKAEGDGAAHVSRVADAARTWRRGDRVRDLLWRGDVLAEHRRWAGRAPLQLTPDEVVFISASEDAERRTRRSRRLAIAVATLALSGVAVVALVLWRRAAAAEVAASEDATRAEQSAHSLALSAMVARAREYAATSHTVEELAVLRALATRGEAGKRLAIENGFLWKSHQRLAVALPAAITAMTTSNDGALTTAYTPGSLLQLDQTGKVLHTLALQPASRERNDVPVAGISPHGKYAIVIECEADAKDCRVRGGGSVTAYRAGVHVREIATGKDVATIDAHEVGPGTIAFSPDDTTIAIHEDARAPKVRILVAGKPEATIDVGPCGGAMRINRRGDRLAIACEQGVRVVDLVTPAHPNTTLPTGDNPVLFAFTEDTAYYTDYRELGSWDSRAGDVETGPSAERASSTTRLMLPRAEPGPHLGSGEAPMGEVDRSDAQSDADNNNVRRSEDERTTPHFELEFGSVGFDPPYRVYERGPVWHLLLGDSSIVDGGELPTVPPGTRCLAAPGGAHHTVTSLDRGRSLLVDEVELVPFGRRGDQNHATQLSNAQLPIREYRPARLATADACARWETEPAVPSLAMHDAFTVLLPDGRLLDTTTSAMTISSAQGALVTTLAKPVLYVGDSLGVTFVRQPGADDVYDVTSVDLSTTPPTLKALGTRPSSGEDGAIPGAIVIRDGNTATFFPTNGKTPSYTLKVVALADHSPYATATDGGEGTILYHVGDHATVHAFPALDPLATSVLEDASGRIGNGTTVYDKAGKALELAHDADETLDWEHNSVDASGNFLAMGTSVWSLRDGTRVIAEKHVIGLRFVGDEAWWIANAQAPHLVRASLANPKQRKDVPLATSQVPFFEAADIVVAHDKRLVLRYRLDRSFEAQAMFDADTGDLLWVGTNAAFFRGDWIIANGRAYIPDFDVAHLLANTGARTNLRACEDDMRVVAVEPAPPADSVWAPKAACATAARPQISSSSPSRAGVTATP